MNKLAATVVVSVLALASTNVAHAQQRGGGVDGRGWYGDAIQQGLGWMIPGAGPFIGELRGIGGVACVRHVPRRRSSPLAMAIVAWHRMERGRTAPLRPWGRPASWLRTTTTAGQ